jgi:hypothetical protein
MPRRLTPSGTTMPSPGVTAADLLSSKFQVPGPNRTVPSPADLDCLDDTAGIIATIVGAAAAKSRIGYVKIPFRRRIGTKELVPELDPADAIAHRSHPIASWLKSR